MKAAFVIDSNKVAIEEIDKPVPAENEVLIKVEIAGVCGSDLHLFHGTHAFRKPPAILGHEVAGTVVEVGKNAKKYQIGDRVTVLPQVACGTCEYCRKGLENLCINKVVPGTPKWIGTFVEYFPSPEQVVYPLNDNISMAVGALIEPLAVAVRVINKISVPEKDSIVILGTGSIGMLTLVVARERGYKNIICTDTAEFNRKMALELGASAAVDPLSEDVPARVRELTGGRGADVAIIAAGAPNIFDQATASLHKCGQVGIVAMITKNIPVYTYSTVFNELTVFGAMTYSTKDFEDAWEMVNNGLDLSKFVTQTLDLDHTQQALDVLSEKKENVIKVQVKVS
ncbi:MAG: alcohol dehydrogenase catalytic domain-containing protein [Methylobacteriaceae bacterium]|jgi:L-iditol 2-dehydrogenase|nr:alcohol dehydrogenase catalytic domain-containing protein [Methylobacteriaceae bacterium]